MKWQRRGHRPAGTTELAPGEIKFKAKPGEAKSTDFTVKQGETPVYGYDKRVYDY